VREPAFQQAGKGFALERDLSLGGLLHQSGGLPLGRPPPAVHGGRDVPIALGLLIAAQGHPHLPNAR
jgi:hypothetical protein